MNRPRLNTAPVLMSLVALLCTPACKDQELHRKHAALQEEVARLREEVSKAQAEAARARNDVTKKDLEITALQAQLSARTVEEIAHQLRLSRGEKLFATFKTSMGDMVAELFWEQVPYTVANFVALAEGTKEWTDPNTMQKVRRPLYDGTLFHRVIPQFMVQGGDPLGNGKGGPGYRFADEFHPTLQHNRPGVMSMANSGPGTNGSQFFITEQPAPWLDNLHTVFGRVTQNVELLPRMTAVPRDQQDRPKQDLVLIKVLIGRGAPKT